MAQLLIDLRGTTLEDDERQWLQSPAVAGVILFTRNFESTAQLKALIADCRAAAGRPIVMTVDHEGGRVQRFRGDFTRIPAAGSLLRLAGGNLQVAAFLAWQAALVMAAELRALDVDLSYAPVLDLGINQAVIGDRAFSDRPELVARLSAAYARGMADGGMAACGKHFPGHGHVVEDSHHQVAVDDRPLDAIEAEDMAPFRALIEQGLLGAVMPAHVIFAQLDGLPASASPYWLKSVLRERLGFRGLVFSDDLSMKGAGVLGTPAERAHKAAEAGCDLLLCCNDPEVLPSVIAATAQGQRVDYGPLLGRAPRVGQETIERARQVLRAVSGAYS
ncbi:beta-N-acetylhexosaminidase [Gallaecimonas sp. GXIMD4217]|uniref:beta-N-acetylhexosaminidase n=1 Tax=Gallaecimonas sp. GXIMD4217 TaxID=3131927 RepID=UPI00311AC1BD